ncbi:MULTISPECIES: DNA topoisomerase I [Hydrocarboniphaga]|jgi:DNA topoisomerase-1|uniref:DNA topoisomerase 1 n=3 Tax=Hydrocarboniphaga effusa TaxID=243629 RepID=I8TCK6_9GAMM|nr:MULTISPECIES: DNA topoisomerase I [Hydrocarboniphaga]EIT71680.1 DNA topoisomerase I [Hydrocarboniphaga effusa AP103]MDZ4080304.1 DNA topoisomerase I [Hydrocarboniphaga sp.]
MSKNLVIVESPAKAKTIKKYLGKDYEVLASYGHVRDLVPKDGAVDPEADFQMKYQIIDRNEKHVRAITSALKDADSLYLATDPDREGEAISWHLVELLKEKNALKGKTVKRVVFHEITQRAVSEAIAHPRDIADDLVNAQQARRALDYLVGFNLSPLLWRKVQPGLSAGRVQSPALRLICEREEEIKAFVAQEYWTLEARAQKEAQSFSAKLIELDGQKVEQFTLTEEGGAEAARKRILAAAQGSLKVASVDKKQRRRNPSPPFTTSTLQQEANRKLGFTSSRTMRTAQQLYEGVDLGGDTVGLISYMRTDSVSLAQEAIAEIRKTIVSEFGASTLPPEPRYYKSKSKNAQEAHEAVRPTSALRTPKSVARYLTPDQAKLYELIWKRTMACQMTAAVFDTVAADLKAGAQHAFRANGSVLLEPGFLAAYNIKVTDPLDKSEDDDEDDKRLPVLVVGETVNLLELDAEQHFTQPPPRYTEASLVKTLEEFDIGRPSTYATIISTLQARDYVRLDGKQFTPTDVGMIVNKFLTDHFNQYVDYEFTAKLEDSLDEVSRGEKAWQPLLADFWGSFKPRVDEKMELSRQEVSEARQIGIDPETGKPVSARLGRFGPFVQIGTKDDPEKPRFASLRANQRIDTITLEDALALFQLPRRLGTLPNGEEVKVNIGRFGPYVQHGKSYVSLKRDDDPYTIGLPRAIELIEQKAAALEAATIKVFDGTGIRIVKGRFGPYITDGTRRANIPKTRDPESLSALDCEFFLNEAALRDKPAKGKKGGKSADKADAAAKAATKKASAKKAPAKKSATKKAVKKSSAKKKS